MPPPVTPSPHRFVTSKSKARRPSPVKEPNPKPPVQQTPSIRSAEPTHVPPPSTQFASTPRFAFAKPKSVSKPLSTPQPQVIQALRTTIRRPEDVEDSAGAVLNDAAWNDDDEEMLDNGEGDDFMTNDSHDLPFSPKRRRIDDNGFALPSLSPRRLNAADATPLSPPRPPHRFVQPSLPPPSSSISQAPSVSRPSFVRPAQNPTPATRTEPLPEAFSPHRRGSKFVPGGTASAVQQWILEAGHAAAQARRSYARVDEYALKLRISEVKGSGPFTVRGDTADGEVQVILAGHWVEGVEIGSVIGVKAPTWEVQASPNDALTMAVGVDWKVLS